MRGCAKLNSRNLTRNEETIKSNKKVAIDKITCLHANFVDFCIRMKFRRTISQTFNKSILGIAGSRAQIQTHYLYFPLLFSKTQSYN